jgi:hypothetical protein
MSALIRAQRGHGLFHASYRWHILDLRGVAGYLPREQTAPPGGGVRHGATSGRQHRDLGAEHFAAAGETAQLARTAQQGESHTSGTLFITSGKQCIWRIAWD